MKKAKIHPFARRKDIKEELETLRSQLEVYTPMDEETWGNHAPQELRDQYAASALISCCLHPLRALQRLGFNTGDGSIGKEGKAYWTGVAQRVFETPGCQEILNRDTEKFAGNKDKVMNTLFQIITDPMAAHADRIRGVSQLAKMVRGWQDGEKDKFQAPTVNFLAQIVNGGVQREATVQHELPPGDDTIIDAESFFVERGEEVAIVTDHDSDRRKLAR